MKISVIGATGFIGRHLCERCIERGDAVTALARNTYASDFLSRNGATTVHGELSDTDSLTRVCADADVVFNLSGVLGKWGKSRDEMDFVNRKAAAIVVACAAKAGAHRVVHASTAGVSGPLPDGVDASEDYPSSPATDYQKSKLEGEYSAASECKNSGLNLVIVRPTFVYGPGDMHKISLFKSIRKRRIILVNGGRSRLHPVHVDDLVVGILLAAERAPGRGETYILGGETAASTRELIETIAGSMQVSPPKVSLPSSLLLGIAALAEAAGCVVRKEPPITRSKVKLFSENYAYKTGKAERELGYRPQRKLTDGIDETAAWYLDHGFIR